MSVVVAWFVFPLLTAAVSLGCGLLTQRAAGMRLPGTLVMPLGLALIVCASQVVTYWHGTAPLAMPLVLALAVAGFVLSRPRWPLPRIDGAAAAAGFAAFCVFAAPVVLSGHATFLGYTLLGDDSVHFVLVDWLMHHGRQLHGLAPSSYHATLSGYLRTAYPLGAHSTLGSLRPLVGQDVAWVYQPFLSFVAAMACLSLYAVLSGAIASRRLRALAAFLATQAGLVYAYALEGSVKEVGTILIIALTVALCAEWLRVRGPLRATVPLAVAIAAGLGILNVSILPWLGLLLPIVLLALFVSRGRFGWVQLSKEAIALLALAAALAYPSLVVLHGFVQTANSALTSGSELGNLLGPLNRWQAFGIWPTGDFRLHLTSHRHVAQLLIAIELLALGLGVVWAVRRAKWWPLALLATSVLGWAYVTAHGSPWSDAKALMILSPALVAVAMLGPAALWDGGHRLLGAALALPIAFGILWTNALAYHHADLAPRDRLSELARIDDRIAGKGPTLYTEAEEFGKHFLRRGDPSGSSEAWQDPPPPQASGNVVPKFGFSTDIDQLALHYVEHFRTLVLRRSGSASRPPSNYTLVSSGRFYEVWERGPSTVVKHVPLGTALRPGATPACSAVQALAGAGSRIAYVTRPELPILLPGRLAHPAAWKPDPSDPTSLVPDGGGTVKGTVEVATPGRYRVWVEGSFSRGFTLAIDGREVGSVHHELSPRGEFALVGETELQAGRRTITLVRPGGSLAPGNGAAELLGPVVLDPATGTRAVQTLPSSRWRELCGQQLDWMEALR